MLPLLTKTFPASASELERLLNESLSCVLISRGAPVRIVERQFPVLEEMTITLDHAEVRRDAPSPRLPKSAGSPGLEVSRLQLGGNSVSLGPASIDLDLQASDVRLDQAKDERDEIVLVLQSARDGRVEVSTTAADVERAIGELARREAARHGVNIEDVRLELRQAGARAVEAEVSLRARKMFFATTVRLNGRLEIDEQLNARLSNLNCAGEGAIGSVACGFLRPHLDKLDGRTIPLMTLSLGAVRLRDVQVSVGNRLTVQAEFGA